MPLIQAGQLDSALTAVSNLIRFVILLAILYVYSQLMLSFFPWTQGLAGRVLELVLVPVRTLAAAVWEQVPKLFFIAVVAVITRYILKLLRAFFGTIESGTITFQNFYKDWAQPTYKIVRLLVIAFAVMVAYPYIPGSSSEAFKGISIFLGILFSLGSTSLVGNVAAGTMMTYMRAFKAGDRVKIGEHVGDVVQTRMQVTHLLTVKNEEIVIPNSVVINSQILNFSSQARDRGLILHTSVTTGYDAPWRQVHALLSMAAERTRGLLSEPPPFVLQKSLDDFYVNYELNVYTDTPHEMPRLYSELHQNIQDAFNEYGVQIMSPNYVTDRAVPTFVPKEDWYAAPAKRSVEHHKGRIQDLDAAGGTEA
jgi:small-conductance mechanosensitive channel